MNENQVKKPEGVDLVDRLIKIAEKTTDEDDKKYLAFAIKHINDLRTCVSEASMIVAPFLFAGQAEVNNILIEKTYAMTVLKPAIDKTAMEWAIVEAEFKKRFNIPEQSKPVVN